jgi:nitroreductase
MKFMNVLEAISQRRSVRAYKKEPVSRQALHQVLEAARLAPSWKDYQCWSIVVLSQREDIRQLGELLRHNPGASVFETAPYFLLFVADPAKSGVRDGKPYYMTDIGIAMENAVLAATELGLGTCWIGAFTEGPIREYFNIPENQHIVAITPLGVPAEAPEARPRKAMDEFVFEGGWNKPLT